MVKIPVFPTQRSCSMAADWMLSMFLMRIESYFNLLIESAIAIETASGNPSGIATIIKTTATIPIFNTLNKKSFEKSVFCVKMMMMTWKIKWVKTLKKVAAIAYLEILLAVFSSFFSKSVCYSSIVRSPGLRFLERIVDFPTQQTMALPWPFIILESVNRKGSGCSL